MAAVYSSVQRSSSACEPMMKTGESGAALRMDCSQNSTCDWTGESRLKTRK
jgi:hypothetical protein